MAESSTLTPLPPSSPPARQRLLAQALGLTTQESPFPWQLRLLDLFLRGEIPRSLDVPTGLGKTATIAIWLLARSLGAPVPRRLIYVVDRRAVVDQATDVAIRLRTWTSTTPSVAAGLGLHGSALPISTLRGQFVDNRQWLEDPAGPAIVVGTVDMVGSRLLFQGYGTSRKMRPYHAGLLGNDSLLVLDEAHLVPPFERLLEAMALRSSDLVPDDPPLLRPPRLRLLSLSATGRSQGGNAFSLDAVDLAHPVVNKRLSSSKRLVLHALPQDASLPDLLAERAWQLSEAGTLPLRCIIFANRRQDAEKSLAALRSLSGLDKLKKSDTAIADVELLVGGRRVFERGQAADTLRRLGFIAGSDGCRDRPAFLFATSAGEVGVDLDADHMVCDLVAWERMVQRLGRVNRRGQGDACVQVLVPALPSKTDAGLLARQDAVLALLERLPVVHVGAHDASPGALQDLQQAAGTDPDLANLIARASTPEPLYPALTRATLDAWSMTSLAEHPGRPVVAPWLRGWVEDRPQTTVIWRSLLPLPQDDAPKPADLARYLEAAPPHASEKLEAETFQVADWLGKRVKRLLRKAAKARAKGDHHPLNGRAVVALLGKGGEKDPISTFTLLQLADQSPKQLRERLLPGATLVLHADLAGLTRQGLLSVAEDAAPLTLDASTWLDDAQDGARPAVGFRVRITDKAEAVVDTSWRERARLPLARSADGEVSQWLVVDKWRHMAATEDDRSAGRPQLLHEHLRWTAEHAAIIADKLELPSLARQVLIAAARLHDEGKRAQRWQRAFSAPADGVYAKTRGPLNVHLLDGYRHEFGSLPIAQQDPELAAMTDDQRQLVLHLIASHHGYARPVISTRGCVDAPPTVLRERAASIALRFARLQRTFGPWGLAWWESLLRAADQQASRANDQAPATATQGGLS